MLYKYLLIASIREEKKKLRRAIANVHKRKEKTV